MYCFSRARCGPLSPRWCGAAEIIEDLTPVTFADVGPIRGGRRVRGVLLASAAARIVCIMASSEHLVEALRGAVQALSEAKVPDDLREIAFAKALDHLLGNAAPGRRVEGSGEHPGAGGDDGSGGKSVDLGNPLGKIAAKFHVDVQTVERFFEVDDDGVHLLMPTRSLSSKKQQSMQRSRTRLPLVGRRSAWRSSQDGRRSATHAKTAVSWTPATSG
jgi:hypothetical protein